jgi:cytochrome c oxidase assembly protein subunit 15
MRNSRILKLLVINIFAQSAIIVTGAIVRITKSGLGCPTWPQCVGDSIIPLAEQEESWHKYVEFGNRLLTFVLLIVAALVFIAVWKSRRSNALILLAATPAIGTVIQAVLGGVTVLTGLHPITVSAHFLVSIVIVGFSFLLYIRFANPEARFKFSAFQILFILSAFTTLILGTLVTGSGPHSGDQFASSRFGFDLTTIANVHSKSVWLFCFISLLLAVRSWNLGKNAIKQGFIFLICAVLVQAGIGYYQFHQGVPEVLVFMHVIGSTIFWIACLNLFFRLAIVNEAEENQALLQKR